MRRFLQLQILPLIALALLSSMNAVRYSYASGVKSDQTLQSGGRRELILKVIGLDTNSYLYSLKRTVKYNLFAYSRKHTKLKFVSTDIIDGAVHLKFQDSTQLQKVTSYLKANLVQKLPSHISDAPDAENLIVSNSENNTIEIRPSAELLRDAEEKAIEYFIQRNKYWLHVDSGSAPDIKKIHNNRILIRFDKYPERIRCSHCWYGRYGQISFHEVNQASQSDPEQFSPPIGSELLEDYHNPKKLHLVKKAKLLTNEDLNFFRIEHDPSSGMIEFSIGFNALGAKLLSEISKKNIGKPFGIIYENKHLGLRKVLSAPVLKSAMLDGRAHIVGSFSLKDAKKIAATVKPGNFNLNILSIEDRKTLRKKE